MNREEKYQLVCHLYKEGKTMREIAKEVHMSFGGIGLITKKLVEQSEPENQEVSKEFQALELYKNGSNPVNVAISLRLTPSKAEGIYKQFWKLRGLHDMLYLYKKIKADISLLSRVHQVVKKYNLSNKDIVNIVDYADELIFLEEDVHEMQRQLNSLLKKRHDANESLLTIEKKHKLLIEQIDNYNDISVSKNSYIENLDDEIEKLENQILKLKTSDEYTKFEQYARKKLDFIMKDRRWLLALAIDTVIESIRKDPAKQMIIKDEITEVHQDKLLDLCEELFEKLLKQFMDVTLELEATQGKSTVPGPYPP